MEYKNEILTTLADTLEIDEGMLKEILILFFENMPVQITTMRKHVPKHEFSAIHVISHTLKGTAANLRYEVISLTAGEIEALALKEQGFIEEYEALFNKLSLQLAHAKMQIFYQ